MANFRKELKALPFDCCHQIAKRGLVSILGKIIFLGLLAGQLTTNVHAQSAVAGQGFMNPAGVAPHVTQEQPPTLTPEQQKAREDAMQSLNRPGPPLPIGPARPTPPVPPTPGASGPTAALPGSGQGGGSVSNPTSPPAPGSYTVFRQTAQNPYSTGTSPTDEPHAGTSGPVVFMSGNWFGSYSTDGGQTFSFVNPYTIFPADDGGFCCDQTVIYQASRDLMMWQLQYIYSATTQQNRYRVAFAKSASVSSSGWCYYDFSPQSFGLAAGEWLDYPHVALSNNFVWYSANVYNAAGNWQTTVIWRIPLDPVSTCSGITFNYFVQQHFNFTTTQGASATMYWGSHNSTSSIRIYHWDETSGTIFWDDVSIGSWTRNLPYLCAGPDGQNWCGRSPNDGRIQTGWVANGVIGFMWNAGQDTNFAYPWIDVARFNQSDRSLINQPIIFNGSYAWQWPAIGVNDRGDIAGSAYWGGGSFYPTMVTLIDDGFSTAPPPWENYGVVTSAQGATNSWGDWYSSRRHGSNGFTWITTGEARLASGSVQSYYVWFGRFQDGIETAPVASKFFGASSIHVHASTSLSFFISNPNTWASLSGIGFSDTLPSGLVVSTPNGLSGSCGGGTITATSGSGSISLSGATLGLSGSCFFSVNVTAASVGTKTNVTSGISSNEGGTGGAAVATITVLSASASHDFNGDGKSDIAWRDTSGDVAFWLMNGAGVSSTGGIPGVPSTWSIVGQRDFNGDGEADLLWHDTSGNTAMWFMNGTAVASSVSVGNIPTNWSIVGTGDFNGDGLGDIIWRDTSGNVAVWLMNGATLSSGVVIGNVPLTWTIVGTGDYNGDGKSDLLWRNNLGNDAIWFMNGTQVASTGSVATVPTTWSVVGTGDFNGDGKSDIVWRDNAGNTSIWLMNGASVLSAVGVGNVPTTWSIALVGDYNGDGMSDLLWRDNSGNTSLWFMNGTTVSSTAVIGNIPTIWTVQSVNAE